MVQSLGVTNQSTFSQIVDAFKDNPTNQHVRLKDDGDGKMLYVHQNKFSLTGHGRLQKESEVMERRFDGSNFVIDAMRRHKSHPGVVDRVLHHVMSDPSFGKKHDVRDGMQEFQVQLRGSDIARLDELLQQEIKRTDGINSYIEPLKREYGHMALGDSITRAMGINHGPANTTNFIPRFQNAIKEKVEYNCAVAVFDDNIKTLFSKDSDHFRTTIKNRTESFLAPEVMNAPEMKPLQRIIGASIALDQARKDFSEDFSVSINLGSGSEVSSPMPKKLEPRSNEPNTRVGYEPPKFDHVAKRLNLIEYQEWTANEIQTKFFDEDTLGLGSQVHKAVTEELKVVNESIARLKDELAKATTTEQRDKISGDIERALNQKLNLMDKALNNRISTVIDVVGGQRDNPVYKTFESLTTMTARSHVIQDRQELSDLQKKQQRV